MIDYRFFLDSLKKIIPAQHHAAISQRISQALQAPHGKSKQWETLLQTLPQITAQHIALDQDCIQIGLKEETDAEIQAEIRQQMSELLPWRKGPYCLFGEKIDAEWRSDWKWNRLKLQIQPLHNKLVLDVGCGNGYHAWRMLGAGARQVIGIDPFMLFVAQFYAIKHFTPSHPIDVLPLGMEMLPENLQLFDTVFSMGVLYHRKSPIDHLQQLYGALTPGGELVLETLIIDESNGQLLFPKARYARMRNVWFIPSLSMLTTWLERCRFEKIQCINVADTTPQEQRSTEWMPGDSLINFLDSGNENTTVEGYPAPKRCIITAQRPFFRK